MVAVPDAGLTGEQKGFTDDQKIVMEANANAKAAREWQGTQDERAREDIKFANADARNAWQWPTKIYADRTEDGNDLPCLTINNTRVHNDLIINDISKQDFAAKVRPVAGKASFEAAKMQQALLRRILDQSRYSSQRRKVAEQQVDGGIGYIIIETRWTSPKSFDQDIYLKASRDPTGVYLDPYIREPDGLDASWGMIFERLPRKEFNRKYPKWKDKVGAAPINSDFAEMLSDKEVVLAKYYRKKNTDDTLLWYKDEKGEGHLQIASEIKEDAGRDLFKILLNQIKSGEIEGRIRKTTNTKVEWFLIAGDQIIERDDWAGKYIPICRCVGRELVIDNTLDRKGHTRPLIDAQRMLNYNASTCVQYGGLQTKTQWVAPARAIEGQEPWKSANIDNFAVLTYNDIDDEATDANLAKVERPQRVEPPQVSQAHQQGMQDAERQMMMISGQFQAQMGENDTQSAASGKAINARKMQADTATWHFYEHQSDMDRAIGVQLLDLMPKIYDTERALQVTGEKGEKFWIRINPNQDGALQELKELAEDEEAIKLAFNPALGEYECVSDPGADYATQRQEAWNALSLILQQSKELAGVCADLLFKYGDFPGADELMERLQKEIKATKPYLFDDSDTPNVQAMKLQVQKLTQLNTELVEKIAESKIKHRGYQEKRDIDAYNADTQRMKATVEALTKLLLTPQQQAQLQHEVEQGAREHVYSMIQQVNQADLTTELEPETEGV